MAVRRRTQQLRSRMAKAGNTCRLQELTTDIPELRRAAIKREDAINAITAEILRLVEERRASQNQPCNGDCEDEDETCIHVLKDDVELAIVVRRAMVPLPLPPGAPPGAVPARRPGFRATFPAARVKSRCECALVV